MPFVQRPEEKKRNREWYRYKPLSFLPRDAREEEKYRKKICHWTFCPRLLLNSRDREERKRWQRYELSCLHLSILHKYIGFLPLPSCFLYQRNLYWERIPSQSVCLPFVGCQLDCHIFCVSSSISLPMTWSIFHCLIPVLIPETSRYTAHLFSLSPVIACILHSSISFLSPSLSFSLSLSLFLSFLHLRCKIIFTPCLSFAISYKSSRHSLEQRWLRYKTRLKPTFAWILLYPHIIIRGYLVVQWSHYRLIYYLLQMRCLTDKPKVYCKRLEVISKKVFHWLDSLLKTSLIHSSKFLSFFFSEDISLVPNQVDIKFPVCFPLTSCSSRRIRRM